MTPNAAPELELMRAAALLATDPQAAARRATEILANSPRNLEACLLLATAYIRLCLPTKAIAILEPFAAEYPSSAAIQLDLGRAYSADGRAADACATFSRAVALDPNLVDGWRELAAQLFALGDVAGGDAAYARHLSMAHESAELRDARKALAEGRLTMARDLAQQRLIRAPNDTAAMCLLAELAMQREHYREAEELLTACLAATPGYAAARFNLARVLLAAQRPLEVLPLLERLSVVDAANPRYFNLKAQALRLLSRSSEALSLMARIVADHPVDEQSWLLYGHLLREVGEPQRAIDAYRRALSIRPACGAYWSVANLKTFAFTAEDVRTIRDQLANGRARGLERVQLEFSLGKALEDAGDYAASIEHYIHGNAEYRASVGYDADAMTADVQRSKAVYTSNFFAERTHWGSERNDPIFIVGLPRSGSTLLEQILASHSKIEGTRELPEVPMIAAELVAPPLQRDRPLYPESVAGLGRAAIDAYALRYLERTVVHRTLGRPHFVDKMPLNFGHIGLIHLMFPRAAIIDARRHPLACGFSCFKQLFAKGMNFTYDQIELARYYRDYAELMEHYDKILCGRIHRVHYEQLVADPEREVRSILAYCGLPYEESCLRFHETRRVVQTVSSEQVRRPIYSEATEHWRHFEAWLQPMREALGNLVDRYPGT
jgi:tetratricopeptide (TPR) repeat protein